MSVCVSVGMKESERERDYTVLEKGMTVCVRDKVVFSRPLC